MGMTLAEKILARHARRPRVSAGELIVASVDLAMSTDITTSLAAKVFAEMGAGKVWDRDRLVVVSDHFTPAKDIATAEMQAAMRRFAREQDLPNFLEVGRAGVCHVVVPDGGYVSPGDLVVGADSHTCSYGALGAFATGVGSTDLAAVWALGESWFRVPPTLRVLFRGRLQPWVGGKDLALAAIGRLGVDGAIYQAIEYGGDALALLPMCDRFSIANMAIEAGAKTGLVPVDEVTLRWCEGRTRRPPVVEHSDPDAEFVRTIEIDVSALEPLVAAPFLPSNVRPAKDSAGLPIDQVVLGSCTNGRVEDLRVAAAAMAGRPVHPRTRMIVIPGSPAVWAAADREGLLSQFVEAGAIVAPPTCGPCIGGHLGILASGERALATTNRNFKGRMGHTTSEIWLAGPAVAGATAVAGAIAVPEGTP
jgi:3-isopropylmalate/(R)-2-methylmalate dehydratase large subunit